jgi:hypothetical protein
MRFVNSVFSDPAQAEEWNGSKVLWPYQECRTEKTREGSSPFCCTTRRTAKSPPHRHHLRRTLSSGWSKTAAGTASDQSRSHRHLARRNRDLDALARCLDGYGVD